MCLMKWAFECLQIDHAHTNHNLYMAVLFVLLLECDDHAVLFTNFIVTFVSVMQMTEICFDLWIDNILRRFTSTYGLLQSSFVS